MIYKMKYPEFCVQAVNNKEFKEFIKVLNELYFAWYLWNAYGTYYWVDWACCFDRVKPYWKLVTPKEWIKILQWKYLLTYDL